MMKWKTVGAILLMCGMANCGQASEHSRLGPRVWAGSIQGVGLSWQETTEENRGFTFNVYQDVTSKHIDNFQDIAYDGGVGCEVMLTYPLSSKEDYGFRLGCGLFLSYQRATSNLNKLTRDTWSYFGPQAQGEFSYRIDSNWLVLAGITARYAFSSGRISWERGPYDRTGYWSLNPGNELQGMLTFSIVYEFSSI